MPMTVMIVDDDKVFRRLLSRLLGKTVTLVGEAADGAEAVALCREKHPELVVMDLSMPTLDGLEATQQIKAESPDTKVILLTSHDEEAYLAATGKSGADILLSKRDVRSQILSVIRSLLPRGWPPWNGFDRRSQTEVDPSDFEGAYVGFRGRDRRRKLAY
ncbi:MAG TPA: response regulator transcription factor [Vicinamibacteria bacterium]|jgi:DNA-binding NarL/FixJ family response regulator|nr:response regulator transcription factor [Vicinamibacteria bacterium]